jgi:outer membrane protein TolC
MTYFSKASNIWFLLPAIDWNIFKGWQTMANIRVQNSKQKQALISYQQAVSQGLKEVESALVACTEGKSHPTQSKITAPVTEKSHAADAHSSR